MKSQQAIIIAILVFIAAYAAGTLLPAPWNIADPTGSNTGSSTGAANLPADSGSIASNTLSGTSNSSSSASISRFLDAPDLF